MGERIFGKDELISLIILIIVTLFLYYVFFLPTVLFTAAVSIAFPQITSQHMDTMDKFNPGFAVYLIAAFFANVFASSLAVRITKAIRKDADYFLVCISGSMLVIFWAIFTIVCPRPLPLSPPLPCLALLAVVLPAWLIGYPVGAGGSVRKDYRWLPSISLLAIGAPLAVVVAIDPLYHYSSGSASGANPTSSSQGTGLIAPIAPDDRLPEFHSVSPSNQ